MKHYFLIGASILISNLYGQHNSQIALQPYTTIRDFETISVVPQKKGKVTKVVYIRTFKWEAVSSNGAVIFGIARTEQEAMEIIADFGRRNQNNSLRFPNYGSNITVHRTFIAAKEEEDIYDSFFRVGSKNYKILTKDELFALDIFINFDRTKGIHYFQKLKNIPPVIAEKRLETLVRITNKYRIHQEQ